MDMETSDDEEEDGQITKYDEEEERDRKLFSKVAPEEEPPVTLEDLNKCRVTRDQIAKYCMTPWFEDYIKGAHIFSSFRRRVTQCHTYRCLDTLLHRRRRPPERVSDM